MDSTQARNVSTQAHHNTADDTWPPKTPQQALDALVQGNLAWQLGQKAHADITAAHRLETARQGQHPYAVVLTCSDSRVPPEHIFCAGVGDLFVVRTAGNVVGAMELGSIEYGAAHLGAMVVLVMGHSGCGAVAAALHGHAHGYIEQVVQAVRQGIGGEADPTLAEDLNIRHAVNTVLGSPALAEMVQDGRLLVAGAKYQLESGEVQFFPPAAGAK